jgi:hypothetical protein
VRAAYARRGLEADLLPFIDDMARAGRCDLVICRAGAITVSELCAAGVPSVLVPLVVSTTAHQRDNAEYITEMKHAGQAHPLRRHRRRRHERHRRDPAQPGLPRQRARTSDSAVHPRLAEAGHPRVRIGHDAAHIAGAAAVVTSTAVKADNPEVLAARERKVPVVPRAQMLAELMRLKQGIAIAGTHGKTTTTSWWPASWPRRLDPTFVIGGRLNAPAPTRAWAGRLHRRRGRRVDASFLNLSAGDVGRHQHRRRPHGDLRPRLRRLKQAFVDFLHRLPFYGVAVLCGDDPACARSCRRCHRSRSSPTA